MVDNQGAWSGSWDTLWVVNSSRTDSSPQPRDVISALSPLILLSSGNHAYVGTEVYYMPAMHSSTRFWVVKPVKLASAS